MSIRIISCLSSN